MNRRRFFQAIAAVAAIPVVGCIWEKDAVPVGKVPEMEAFAGQVFIEDHYIGMRAQSGMFVGIPGQAAGNEAMAHRVFGPIETVDFRKGRAIARKIAECRHGKV